MAERPVRCNQKEVVVVADDTHCYSDLIYEWSSPRFVSCQLIF